MKDKDEVKYTLLHERRNRELEDFIKIYKDDPYYARVKYFNENRQGFVSTRVGLFEKGNGDFNIVIFRKVYKMNKSSRIYSRETREMSIVYKGKKFWFIRGKMVRPLMYESLSIFIRNFYYNVSDIRESNVYEYLNNRFHWLKNLEESPLKGMITFSKIVEKKLYGLNDIHSHILKVPRPIAKRVIKSGFISRIERNGIKWWYRTLSILDNINFLSEELLLYREFDDLINLSHTLGRRVNCKWGLKRIDYEHDNMSYELTNTLLKFEVEKGLDIRDVYTRFAEFSGFKLLRTNIELLKEGYDKKHCVATYIDKINRGECGVYSINGCTLQLTVVDLDWENCKIRRNRLKEYDIVETYNKPSLFKELTSDQKYYLYIVQFKGKYNIEASDELYSMVEGKIKEFVEANGLTDLETEKFYSKKEQTPEEELYYDL